MNKRLITIISLLVLLAACEDDSQCSEQGGGPGSADPNKIIAGDGFARPQAALVRLVNHLTSHFSPITSHFSQPR